MAKLTGDLRIVMLGMTGAGKSATGNTILGKEVFKVDFSPESVTQLSEKKEIKKGSRIIPVIDTPGLQDTSADEYEMNVEIKKFMEMSDPGPNVFLLVFRLDVKFTDEVKNTVQWIRENFGEEAARHTIILFTHADQLNESYGLQDYIEESSDLRQFIMSCGGRFHAFNNEDKENRDQVNELLDKMDEMVLKNEGKHYSTEMFKDVQRRREDRENQRRAEQDRERWEGRIKISLGLLCVMVSVVVVMKKIKSSAE